MEERLVALEQWMMHTDHLVSELNEVLCSVQDRIDEQDRTIKRLKDQLLKQSNVAEEPRSLEDDRPPHY